ncbi:MAG: HD domain-containing protein [Candidatus Nucleicultricaceae bacterium]
MVDLVFPTATHTRFRHSLGADYLASRMCKVLGLKDEESRELAVVTLLVHDIGHGPFSHAFENLLDKKITHEDWTHKFLEDLGANCIKDNNIIIDFINGTHKFSADSENNLIADMASSQLDADRLDYLLRDSHFCGVSLGKVDLNWIISKFEKIEDIETNPRIGIHRKAVNSVEHYLLARRLMTQSIYHHPLVMLYEKLLIILLKNIINKDEEYKKITNKNLQQFLQQFKIFKENRESEEKDKKNKFIDNAYKNYKFLVDYDVWNLIREINTEDNWDYNIKEIAKMFYEREKKYDFFRLKVSKRLSDDEFIIQYRKDHNFKDWEVITLEGGITTYKDSKNPLSVMDVNSNGSEILTNHSDLLNSLYERSENYRYLAIHKSLDEERVKALKERFSPF